MNPRTGLWYCREINRLKEADISFRPDLDKPEWG